MSNALVQCEIFISLTLPYPSCLTLQCNIGDYRRVHGGRQMRAEADADVKRLVEVERNGRPELMHGLTLQANEDGNRVAVLFNAHALGMNTVELAAETVLHVFQEDGAVGAEGEMNHARAVLAEHGLLRVVIKVLADDENYLAVSIAVGIWKRSIGSERYITAHLLPEIAELIARVPDVVAGGVDGVLAGRGIVARAAGNERAANIGLAVKNADGRVDRGAGAMEVCRRRNLRMGGRAGQGPVRHLRRGGGLPVANDWSRAQQQGAQNSGSTNSGNTVDARSLHSMQL